MFCHICVSYKKFLFFLNESTGLLEVSWTYVQNGLILTQKKPPGKDSGLKPFLF